MVPLPGGRVGLVMGDVVGHDLRAAADMGQLRNALRACAADGAPPAEVLHALNRLCVSQELGDMATVLYAVLDPVQGVVEVANAGHLPPLLVTADESCYLESAPSPPVGRGARGDVPQRHVGACRRAACCCCTPTGSSSAAPSGSSRGSSSCARW